MKICFLLQRNFAYVGHAMAIILKEKYNIKEFCGYVYVREKYKFLKQQKDIEYSSLLLDEEIHKLYKNEDLDFEFLKNLEKEYGMPNLWHYIIPDRILMYSQHIREYPYNTPKYTHEEMLKILQVKAKAIISFFEKENPDCIVFSAIGGVAGILLHEIAKKKGIKILHTAQACMDNKLTLFNSYLQDDGMRSMLDKYKEKKINENTNQEAKKFLEKFRNTPKTYDSYSMPKLQQVDRLKQFQFLMPKRFLKSLYWLVKTVYESCTSEDRHDYTYIHAWGYIKDKLKRKLRNIIGVDDLYDEFDLKKPYAYFPLHMNPEIATLLHAQFFQDQIHVIRQIARSLPVGFELYIKEHPRMVAFRPRKYYKELKKNPNVKIINPSTSSFELIQNSKIVTTITGTAGWEAIMFKKPVITFGDVFFNNLSFVKRCHSYEELPFIIKNQIENCEYNEDELIKFISILFLESVDVDFAHIWEREINFENKKIGIEPLVDLLAKKLNLDNI